MDLLMNTITAVGGVFGILIGALVIGIVIAVGVLPLLFISRRNELLNDPSDGVTAAQHRLGKRPEKHFST